MIPSFGEAIRFWFGLGWMSFGGPAGQISLMHKTLVEEKQWISEDRFSHALSYCMLLPGPEAQQLATYLGWILHGVKGGIFAGLLFILPSILIFISISILYFSYGTVFYVISFLNGVKPAVLAIVILAFSNLVLKGLKSKGHVFCFILTLTGMLFFGIPYPYLLGFSLIIGLVSFFVLKKEFQVEKTSPVSNISFGKIDIQTNLEQKRDSNAKILKNLSQVGSIGLILWVLPLLGILLFQKSEFLFWKELILFFTKTALITFGGAYAILPTVSDFATSQAHWITTREMIDGLAFGESTPGPLVMVLTFIGFLAGAHRYTSISAGLLGLFLTAYYTFLPSFILILGGAKVVEKTKESPMFRIILSYVTACVCGVILYLGIYFAKSILFVEGNNWGSFLQNPLSQIHWLSFVWTGISILFLRFKKKFSILWLFASGLFFLGLDLIFHL
ncbi:chromate efflux transporter [Leptospira sp. WS92.C1]